MSMLSDVARNWATRRDDERFTSLPEMLAHQEMIRERSREVLKTNKDLYVQDDSAGGLLVYGPNGHGYAPTHWSFGQLSELANAPAGYMRKLPAKMAAECLNYGLRANAEKEAGLLISAYNNAPTLRALTGPQYGRIWNDDVIRALIDHVGDGVTGQFRVPAPFGGDYGGKITKEESTLFASDRDLFVFLADQENKIEIPNRRNGETGLMSRGVIIGNSEVGSRKFWAIFFLYDYMCSNRNIWGVQGLKEVSIRHTSGAPDKWIHELQPMLTSYANESTGGVREKIRLAQNARIDDPDAFLESRFGKRAVEPMKAIHMEEEERPVESLFDALNAATAYAKRIHWQDERVALELQAGKIMDLVAA